jgi:hypothetical protein
MITLRKDDGLCLQAKGLSPDPSLRKKCERIKLLMSNLSHSGSYLAGKRI